MLRHAVLCALMPMPLHGGLGSVQEFPYGPLEPWFDKHWRLGESELVQETKAILDPLSKGEEQL